ncbi:MAG: HU family DNA-binding protein [Halanaerobiales bacterium]|nr:HU family DNA-binding protein [Halanaerobiales bacterium]
MTKTELIEAVFEEADDLFKKEAQQVVDTALNIIMDYLGREAKKPEEDRDKVQIIGFGSFEVNNRAERKGRNPQTGEEIIIPERKVPVFRKGKTFKKAVEK